MKIFVITFGGIGLVMLAIAGMLYFREQSFLQRAETATGTVTDFNMSSSSEGGSSYCPVIEFSTRDGQPVRYYGNVCSAPPAFDLGDQVEVLYDPDNLDNVQMSGFWSKYVGTVVFGAIGLPFFLLGVWGLSADRPKKKE